MKKITIGRLEKANFPTFNLKDKTVKIDSGAYTSSIDIYKTRLDNNHLYVKFEENMDELKFEQFETKKIKSSNGSIQNRYIISGEIILGEKSFTTSFSLTDRSGMRYPILIGRKLLNKNFLIDTSKKFLLKD